ncbi:CapA family protein [Anaerocolumna sp. AGMB13025]|uniref:CapA family protein n=1 Tax=Anaerocolumna sp. AGMB13025 TaxID=3039116 RepID=UPI00241E7030|nr:CapA family protein [Anaerocolumna sp. AGMB13025]WFR59100.1 CapA family protein [Anaerocolumna sp. AGMB13025]
MITATLKFICKIDGWLHRSKFLYSRESEGNSACMSIGEKLWWGYKYFYRPVEKAEKGKNIEEFFEKQELDFTLLNNFKEEGKLSFTAGGDILASHHIRPDNTLHLWEEAEDFLFDTDICCANLETPVVPSASASFVPVNILKAPALNNTPEVFELLFRKGKGINFFSTANNHCLDMGEAGLLETLDFLDKKGCPHVGTARNENQRDDFPVIEKNGIRIAFLSYTFSTNGKTVPEGREYLVNYIRLNRPDCDISFIEKQINKAKTERKADLIIACLHWSLEFEAYPIRNVIDMGHKLLSLGIDIIVGNHPHGIQPMEKYAFVDPYSGVKKQGLIVYALGDLISCHDHIPNSRLNNLIRLKISKGKIEGKQLTIISELRIRPMYIYSKMEGGNCMDFRLLNFNKLINEIKSGNNRFKLEQTTLNELNRLEALKHKLLKTELMDYISPT